jgi:hypothetical protein
MQTNSNMQTHSARIYPPNKRSGRLIVKQTVKNKAGRFIIDGQKERFVLLSDDKAIASAIRDALAGKLKNKDS